MSENKTKVNPARWRFLSGEVQAWEAEGLISHETAQQILDRYDGRSHLAKLALMAIMGIGALMVGLGLITIVAANWEALSVSVRCAIVLGALLLCQAGLLYADCGKKPNAVNRHVFAILEALVFGGAIALLAQIFNITSDTGSMYGVWTVSSLFIAVMARSAPVAAVACVTSVIWYFYQHRVVSFEAEPVLFSVVLVYPILHMAVFTFLGWYLRSGLLCAVSVFTSLIMGMGPFAFMRLDDMSAQLFRLLWVLILCNGTQLLTGHLERRSFLPELRFNRLPATVARLFLYGFLFFLTFDKNTGLLLKSAGSVIGLATVGVMIISGQCYVMSRLLTGCVTPVRWAASQAICGLFAVAVCLSQMVSSDSAYMLYNLVIAAFGLADLARGFSDKKRTLFWRGLLLLLLLIVFRFCDIQTGLVAKGLCFIAVGVGVGYIGREFECWLKKQNALSEGDHEI